jgi:hypothetical protein
MTSHLRKNTTQTSLPTPKIQIRTMPKMPMPQMSAGACNLSAQGLAGSRILVAAEA